MRGLRQPADFVYLLLDLQRLEVVELGLMTDKCAVHVVLHTSLTASLHSKRQGKGTAS